MGTLNVLGHFAKVLIDCGATHFVISFTLFFKFFQHKISATRIEILLNSLQFFQTPLNTKKKKKN
jgi:hypothetical protein